jgi:hypothetical protein
MNEIDLKTALVTASELDWQTVQLSQLTVQQFVEVVYAGSIVAVALLCMAWLFYSVFSMQIEMLGRFLIKHSWQEALQFFGLMAIQAVGVIGIFLISPSNLTFVIAVVYASGLILISLIVWKLIKGEPLLKSTEAP